MSDRPLLGGGDSINGSGSSQDLEGQGFAPYRTFPPSPMESRESLASVVSSTRTRVNPKIVSDAILGLSDGLTVPFALSAGLSALGNTRVVVVGGLAELVAGAISMGLGGYVGSRSEVEAYEATVRETKDLVKASPAETMTIIRQVFAPYNLPDEPVARMSNILHDSPQKLLDFLLTFHHKESKPSCNRAWISAITLALGYFIGGFIPLIPYFLVDRVLVALYYSIGIMAITLLVFGYVKTCVVRGWTGRDNIVAGIKGGFQMVVVGGLAAGASIALVRAINPSGNGLI
ncbi:Protein ccc1 [Microsporum ferrugineum]